MKQALKKVGIQAPDSKREIVGENFATNTINYSIVSKVTIGRTNLTVKVDSSETYTQKNTVKEKATASLTMEYSVTANELKFIAQTASYMGELETSLYVVDAVKKNKGIITAKILRDAKLPVTGGKVWGTVGGLQFTYDMADKGFTVEDALKMYKEEVTDPKMAEAYAAITVNVMTSGISLKRMGQAKSSTSSTRPAAKPKPSENALGTGQIVQSRINIANGQTRFTPLRPTTGQPVSAGWNHVVDGHFNVPLANTRSVFSISQSKLKDILQSPNVVKSPVTAIEGGQYVRTVNTGEFVGNSALKFGGEKTTWIKIFTDKGGNLITTYPIPAPK
ncbi:hypothetical protein J7E73_31715 [Paenibacillus albidus]|uniref:hypothetical protein n=1 Tax=Paenibacillus albidus TaxID=2041023 RepID=UPI001BE7383E|nr:hypothetical protein [Paenibacillus albidus]MBT2293581.1 hypothetical protein [Paenibacillus albidus]